MTEKIEALRLVDVPFALREGLWHTQADHVLLNLHVDNKQLRAQRDALLEALGLVYTALNQLSFTDDRITAARVKARAAIKQAEEA